MLSARGGWPLALQAGKDTMFQVAEISVQLIELLRPLVSKVKARDRSLADQLTRAASSICLNLAESQHSEAGNRRARLMTAAGSASESSMALRVAVAWGYLRADEGKEALALLNRILAILWRITRRN